MNYENGNNWFRFGPKFSYEVKKGTTLSRKLETSNFAVINGYLVVNRDNKREFGRLTFENVYPVNIRMVGHHFLTILKTFIAQKALEKKYKRT